MLRHDDNFFCLHIYIEISSVVSDLQSVPVLVDKCIEVIEKIGLKVEGVYRICGNSISITEFQEELDKVITSLIFITGSQYQWHI